MHDLERDMKVRSLERFIKQIKFDKKITEISEEDIEEFLDEDVKESFVSSIEYPSFQGWYYDIILSEDGLMITEPVNSNSTVEDVYNGEAVRAYRMDACNKKVEKYLKEYDDEDLKEKIISSGWNIIRNDISNSIYSVINDTEKRVEEYLSLF